MPAESGFTRVYLNMEWGETPFAFGPGGWPCPLLRPEDPIDASKEPSAEDGTLDLETGLLERCRAAEREFLAVQAELRKAARLAGHLGAEEGTVP